MFKAEGTARLWDMKCGVCRKQGGAQKFPYRSWGSEGKARHRGWGGVGMEVGVLVSTAGFRHQAKTKGLQSGVDIGVKYSEKQERNFDDATMKAGQCVIGLQVGLRDWTGP